MKILFFIGTLLGGGAERTIVNLANYLANKKHNISILNFEQNDSKYTLDNNINRYYLNHKRNNILRKIAHYLFGKKMLQYRLKRFLKKYCNYDLLVVFLEHPTILCLKLRKYINCQIIVSERSFPGSYSKKMQKKLLSLCNLANGYVFQTIEAQKWYGDKIKNSTIIPNAVNKEFIETPYYYGKRVKKIVTVGRLIEQKNHKLLIDSFIRLNRPDYTLEIYGEGPLQSELEEYLLNNHLENRVFLRGFSNSIKDLIINASVFVLTSLVEGIPNSLMEAMCLGLPCISTNFAGGGVHTIIKDRVNGLIVNDYDCENVKNAIEEIIDNNDLQQKLSINAYNSIRQFSPEIIYEKWEKYMINIFNGGK